MQLQSLRFKHNAKILGSGSPLNEKSVTVCRGVTAVVPLNGKCLTESTITFTSDNLFLLITKAFVFILSHLLPSLFLCGEEVFMSNDFLLALACSALSNHLL